MEINRAKFEGVKNVLQFNRHFYIFPIYVIFALVALLFYVSGFWQLTISIFILLFVFQNLLSLSVSYFIYDRSDLYQMKWLKDQQPSKILTLTAGFDETSNYLKDRFPNAEVVICDFYDEQKHTERSIQIARSRYPLPPKTIKVTTAQLPFENSTFDLIIGFLAVHEIRNPIEISHFLKELNRVLKPNSRCYLTEHLRDMPNFLAYNLGALHFHSKSKWLKAFLNSDFMIKDLIKVTPFISTFELIKNDTST